MLTTESCVTRYSQRPPTTLPTSTDRTRQQDDKLRAMAEATILASRYYNNELRQRVLSTSRPPARCRPPVRLSAAAPAAAAAVLALSLATSLLAQLLALLLARLALLTQQPTTRKMLQEHTTRPRYGNNSTALNA